MCPVMCREWSGVPSGVSRMRYRASKAWIALASSQIGNLHCNRRAVVGEHEPLELRVPLMVGADGRDDERGGLGRCIRPFHHEQVGSRRERRRDARPPQAVLAAEQRVGASVVDAFQERGVTAYLVTDAEEAGGKAIWDRVGKLFAHADRKGFNLLLDRPVQGKLVVREDKPKKDSYQN